MAMAVRGEGLMGVMAAQVEVLAVAMGAWVEGMAGVRVGGGLSSSRGRRMARVGGNCVGVPSVHTRADPTTRRMSPRHNAACSPIVLPLLQHPAQVEEAVTVEREGLAMAVEASEVSEVGADEGVAAARAAAAAPMAEVASAIARPTLAECNQIGVHCPHTRMEARQCKRSRPRTDGRLQSRSGRLCTCTHGCCCSPSGRDGICPRLCQLHTVFHASAVP